MTTPPRPAWLTDALDAAERRSGLLGGAVAGLLLLGVVLAIVVPDVVPPTPSVGAGVAIAAILLGLAITVAVDAGSDTVRGPRDVQITGADLVAVLPSDVDVDAVRDLATAVLDARPERRLILGLAGTSPGVDVAGWTDALGVAVAEAGASVLIVDLASGATPHDGLLEVVGGGVALGRAVTFEDDIKLARLGAGRDLDRALEAATVLPGRLPRDLEVLLVGLPPVTGSGVLAACAALDAVLVGAVAGETPRVRLQAGLEAIDGAGGTAQVLLIDDRTVARRGHVAVPGDPTADDPAATGVRGDGPEAFDDVARATDGSGPADDDVVPRVDPVDAEAGARDVVVTDAPVTDPGADVAPEPGRAADAPDREDLSRSPSPSVRIVHVAPSSGSRDDAVGAVDDAVGPSPGPVATPEPRPEGTGEVTPAPARDVAAPRDPQVIAGAAAAGLAARLVGSDAFDAVAPPETPRRADDGDEVIDPTEEIPAVTVARPERGEDRHDEAPAGGAGDTEAGEDRHDEAPVGGAGDTERGEDRHDEAPAGGAGDTEDDGGGPPR